MGSFWGDDTDGGLAAAAMAQAAERRDDVNAVQHLTERVRAEVVQLFSANRLMHPDGEVTRTVRNLAGDYANEYVKAAQSQAGGQPLPIPVDQLINRIEAEILGLGQLEALISADAVEDVVINGPGEVWFFRHGGWELTDVTFDNEEHVLRMLNRAIAPTGRQVSPISPIVDAIIPGGHRINIVMRPCAEPSPCAAIRIRRSSGFSIQDFLTFDMRRAMSVRSQMRIPNYQSIEVEGAMLSGQAAAFLHAAVLAGMNIVVVGGTGVGKTSFLGALGRLIPDWHRILVIEDTRELNMRPVSGEDAEAGMSKNCIYFTTRQATMEGTAPVTQSDLVRAALRQRPDALTLGEARGGEVLDLLKALCTGHKNGLTSVHAETVAELVSRLKLMFQEADIKTEVRDQTVAEWIAKAFHIGIALEMGTVSGPQGTGRIRRVKEIVEFSGGVEGGQPARQTLFEYSEQHGHMVRKPVFLSREAMLVAAGFTYRDIVAMGDGGY